MVTGTAAPTPPPDPRADARRSWSGELSGAFGDLGTFIPHTLGAITVAGMSSVGVLTGFGLLYLAVGLFYRLPIPVQPMKAVSAVLLTSGLSAGQIAAAGLLMGLILVVLGVTGIIRRLARTVPQSVTTGLQLGLGISLAWLSIEMMAEIWWLGIGLVVMLAALSRVTRLPATLVALAIAIAVGRSLGLGEAWPGFQPSIALPTLVVPGLADLEQALRVTVLPQLALTVTNAIIVTAALSGELFGPSASRATPVNLALSSGLANLILAPVGALPMCHGAGGLAAHYRFGARGAAAPLLLGVILCAMGLVFPATATAMLAMIPLAGVGALLLLSAIELAWSKSLVAARPACLPVIAITAATTLLANPMWGLVVGWAVEAMAGRLGMLARDSSEQP